MKYQIKVGKRILRFMQHKFFPKPTYAALAEDLVVETLIGKVTKFIDIGANNGLSGSNTFLFALKGAKGLCFEPIPSIFFYLKYLYWINKEVKCINEGVSDREQILQMRSQGVLSSIIKTEDPNHKEHLKQEGFIDENAPILNISCRPLNYWVSIYPEFLSTDLISIDVEGHELNVLQGIDLSQVTAKCLVIEVGSEMDSWIHQDYEQINIILHGAGYTPVVRNQLNMFWMRNDLINKERINRVLINFQDYAPVIV
ncbi:MAG TPA: hypothetical protein DEG17_21290 [Cyanobacteria bacterium UBA11149]|nr:hypothetical protein [Cyanobacteria bacterium UBA11367]HBE55941.1 hypothetical protein [Cyanobacteria bacterium UBA11366]HBK63657.1 hypothetical protein [Cyanobacteria bacterium UBA11166]HBR77156.1 hypothetical protein [Cyanobacteria bacterium UBA11159]HBS68651.1 hypothetical protein [Cyanobacteria bacterium UBA11153]HBW91323.1 hypothetical protein [Cyanobacteria bacterium UBA11149]HCA93633.1 hypothetical protein [Cyanobacteria bacterium UBA9226]